MQRNVGLLNSHHLDNLAQFIQFKYYLCRLYHCETCGIKFSVREKLEKHRHENMMDGMLKMWDM
jgi:hypothetical protein